MNTTLTLTTLAAAGLITLAGCGSAHHPPPARPAPHGPPPSPPAAPPRPPPSPPRSARPADHPVIPIRRPRPPRGVTITRATGEVIPCTVTGHGRHRNAEGLAVWHATLPAGFT